MPGGKINTHSEEMVRDGFRYPGRMKVKKKPTSPPNYPSQDLNTSPPPSLFLKNCPYNHQNYLNSAYTTKKSYVS